MNIPFNKPYLTGQEKDHIGKALQTGNLSGNGPFTKNVQKYFKDNYGFQKTLLTTSCTDALEMAAILANIQAGDEVIMPSYTFVSTANAFVLRGATIRFVDSLPTHPNIDHNKIEEVITSRTKAIVVVHYAGVACHMEKILAIAQEYNLYVVEDAAQAIDSFYKGQPLGGIGDFGTFSFHETKNIISGEGGMLSINNKSFFERSEIIWEKGTNRSAFYRGEVDKYGWVDIGSSFLPSEIIAAFLWAQLENLKAIQHKRIKLWNAYHDGLKELENRELISLPNLPSYATNNGHMYYIICNNNKIRSELIKFLKSKNILAVFHYLSLHNSSYYRDKHDGRSLPNSEKYTNRLLRLPMYGDLSLTNVHFITSQLADFYS